MADARAHVFIDGTVQGVHFRDNLHETCRAHDVDGWTRNLEDDRVEAVFEGAEGDVRKAVEWCKRGPPKAEVDGVNVEWGVRRATSRSSRRSRRTPPERT